ncbi:PASTA domain-containing protein [bacterium]|nr:PASTA domain-containing protein [bacterium]
MNFPAKQVTKRYAFVASILVLAGLAVLGKAFYTMTVKKDFWMAVSDRFVKENDIVSPTRGNILADNGEVLASSLPEYKIYMDYMSWEKDSVRRAKEQHKRDSILLADASAISGGMHRIFPDIDSAQFREHLLKGREKKSHHWQLYNKRITYIQYRQCKTLPIFNKSANTGGFHTEEFKTRKNPYGRLAIRTIGDLYKGKDSARTGLELSFDSVLRGKPGIAHRQKVLSRYLTIIDKPAEDGYDIMTTLNVGMQDICEKALSDKLKEIEAESGVCILMEVSTGDIKAMTSLQRMSDGSYQEVNADAVKNLYEPGSVFKPMSFLVGMDDGFIKMTDVVDVGCGIKEMYGRKMRDANWRSGGSGVVTVPQILQKSLNVGVSTLIDRYYHKDPRKFVEGIYRIGVAEDLKIPIPGYARPRIRMPKEDGSNWSKTALPWMSIGYETQIPPITTVTFYNGIANNGKLVRPRLVKAVLKGGEVVKEFPVVVLREQMARPEAVKNIQDCLESVVSVGLGKKAGSKYFHTSGKTGTAQIWTKNGFCSQYLVSFAGYFPSEEPLYSCIVCIKKGAPASGGGMCAPVFRRVAETVMAQRKTSDYGSARDTVNSPMPMVCAGSLNAAATVAEQLDIPTEGNVQPDASTITWGRCETSSAGLKFQPNEDDHAKVVPDVIGYGLRDALFKLEKAGLKVKTIGLGRVSRQSLPPGKALEPGQEIELVLGNPEVVPKAERPDSVKADTTKAEKSRQEPEDSELTPTLHEEKKLKQQDQAQQPEKKQPVAPKQKAKKDAQVTTKPETQKKKEQEKKSSKKSAHNQANLTQKRRTA